jgi:hypothetical protein
MTEPIDEPTPATEPDAEDTALPDDGDDEVQDLRAMRRLRTENKRLRHELREAQENYGSAAARLAAAQRREAERIAGEVLHEGSDLWRVDPELQQEFYDEEFGEVTRDRVVEAAKALAADKPHLGRPPAGPPPTDRPLEGLRGGARPEEPTPAPSWASALRGGPQ